jgi:hypothetical protein
MHIITNFCSSPEITFWSKYGSQIVSFVGIIASASIAIFLFNKGLQKERRRFQDNRETEKRDRIELRNKELRGVKDQIEVLLNSEIRAADNEIEEYLSKSFDILKYPYKRLIISSFTHENLKRLLSIDTKIIWEVFSKFNINNKEYINLYSCLDYFSKVYEKVHEDVYEGNGQTSNNLMNDSIKIRNNILDVATNYLHLERGRNSAFASNIYWALINTIIMDYYKDNDGIPDIKRDYDMLITRFKTELLKEEFKYFPTSDEILKLCKIGGDIYFSITQINKDLAGVLITVSERIQDMNIKLSEINEKLKSAKRIDNG